MIYSKFPTSLFITAFILFISPIVLAQSDIRSEQIRFERGASSAVIEGTITGYETVDYILNARVGQSMNVSMATDNGANYFNILEPGETEVAIFNGSIGNNQYEGVLRKSGNYTIRVYMMRSAARRNEVANYRLETSITGAGDRSTIQRSQIGCEQGGGGAAPTQGFYPCTPFRFQKGLL